MPTPIALSLAALLGLATPAPLLLAPELPAVEAKSKQLTPLDTERLPKPIPLPHCPALHIVEWRPTPGKQAHTSPTRAAIKHVDAVCAKARNAFASFARRNGLRPKPPDRPPVVSLCFMPADRDDHGSDYRNLNDLHHRFSIRRGTRSDGLLWGYFHQATHHIFMRNDALTHRGKANPAFRTVLGHEIWHAWSYIYRLHDRDDPTRQTQDETLARAFTKSLGWGE